MCGKQALKTHYVSYLWGDNYGKDLEKQTDCRYTEI